MTQTWNLKGDSPAALGLGTEVFFGAQSYNADGPSIYLVTDLVTLTAAAIVASLHAVPSGGTAGQALVKTSGTDYAYTWQTLPVLGGGTGIISYAVGDLLYASTTTALAKLAGVATGNALISGGVNTAPSWGKVGLTTHISGILGMANGGTAVSLTASDGGIVYSTASAMAILTATATARQMLQSGASGAPAWSTTTWPATTTASRILYSSATSVIGEITSANSSILVTDGSGVPSLSATLPAVTLGGTVSGGGNQINNVIIGTSTPLAGSFTTVAASTSVTVTSASAVALAVGLAGATNPAFVVDSSTSSQAAGFKITGAATGGTVALVVTDSGSNANVTFNAKGSGTIGIGSVSTGPVMISPALTLSAALTYGGVTLTNAATGTGKMVLDTSPALVTPALGVPASGIATNLTGLPLTTGVTGTLPVANGGTNGGTVAAARSSLGLYPGVAGGRVTLTSETPVLTTTVSGATTVYYAIYLHQFVPIYDGTNINMTDIGGELSQATTDSTKSPAACTTNRNYDLFVWSDGGTLRCTRGPAWSSDTSRGTGAGTTELQKVFGVWLNKVTITNGPAANRGTYVGTIRTNGSSQVDYIFGAVAANGTAASFGVWNFYNRLPVTTFIGDTTDSWTYSTATWRAANASNTMRCSYVAGFNETIVNAVHAASGNNSSNNSAVAVGVDVTNDYTGNSGWTGSTANVPFFGSYAGYPGIGFHFVQAVEYASGATGTFFGDGGATWLQSGLTVTLTN